MYNICVKSFDESRSDWELWNCKTDLLWMDVKVCIVHKQRRFFFSPIQQNVHILWEPETLVDGTFGELLAIWISGNLKGKIPSSIWYTYFFFGVWGCFQNNQKLEGKDKYLFLCMLYVTLFTIIRPEWALSLLYGHINQIPANTVPSNC